MKKNKKWLIWSVEHGQWWKPNRHGYCSQRTEAGRYSFKEACEIVDSANWRISSVPKEAMMMAEED